MEGEGGIAIGDEILAAAAGQDLEEEPEAATDAVVLPEQEAECDTNLDEELNDAVNDMTYGRRLARRWTKYAWYNPHVNDAKESVNTVVNGEVEVLDVIPPSLDSAWTYFEHYSLPRHLLLQNSVAALEWFCETKR